MISFSRKKLYLVMEITKLSDKSSPMKSHYSRRRSSRFVQSFSQGTSSKKTRKRMERELEEFSEYFPEVRAEKIPEEIWERVKGGESLAASYALFIRKGELERSRISDFNKKNRKMSSGSLVSDEGEKYYSPSEVRKMTPAEVRQNYDVIIESMRHWN